VYDLKDIEETFKSLLLLKSEFYLRMGEDYFNRASWVRAEPEKCCVPKEKSDAVVCLELVNAW
jgi:hypothetical protein